MKKLIKILFFFGITIIIQNRINAQQDMQFSMYMFNPTFVNPAAAGYLDRPQLSSIFKYQWVGIPGAPKSGNVSFHTPIKEKSNIAVGGTLKYDKIGLMNNIGLDANFAYRLKLDDETRLSLGLMGSMFFLNDSREDGVATDDGDPAKFNLSSVLPNFGPGVYLFSKRYFVGASVPHLLKLKINGDNLGKDGKPASLSGTYSKIYNHYFASAGYVFGKDEGTKFKPQVFFKMSDNSSPNFDINANFLIKERYWLGAGYRIGGDVIDESGAYREFSGIRGESLVGIFKALVTQQLEIGYAYDYTLSRLNNNTSGSHEIFLGYNFGASGANARFISPRYVNYF